MLIKMYKSIITAALLAICQYAFPQTDISSQFNSIRVGDILEKQQLQYLDAGESGEGAVWDFSGIKPMKDFPVEYSCDSDSAVIYELTPVRINKYRIADGSLVQISTENPLEKIEFSVPVKQICYPFYYGDTIASPYSGTGLYCLTHRISKQGEIDVEADGAGMILLSDEDTIPNVIRIHSIRTGSLFMHADNDSTEEANARTKQEIEERYQWYARGYRYPLFETVSTSYYDNMDLVSCIQDAFCFVPDKQKNICDEQNDSIQKADSVLNSHNQDIIHYSIENTGNQVKLSYSLDKDASITLLVCNHRGMMYRRASFTQPAGEGYIANIDCSGLTPDTYILYINVNGKVYSEKIQKK